MNTKNLIAISAFAASLCFAAEEASTEAAEVAAPSAVETCSASLDAAAKDIPANAVSAKYSLAAAKAALADLDAAFKDDPESEATQALAAKCDIYAKIVAAQAEKVNDLEAEKAKMKDQEARLQAEMQQNQEKFQAEAAAKEAALKAASEREANLQKQQADLQKQQADLQKQLEAEKKALAEERAKAEARQAEAMNKLNELQSKLIQVTKDARGIILSMSDILFDVNKASLKADLKTSLAKVAGILSVYQQFNVSIEGNTDNTGSEEHNMKLSQQRADNVMKFLVDQGIDAGRLTAKGLGMSMPIADNKTKEGRQKNRRVDLVIQDKALQQSAEPAAAEPAAEPAAPEAK